jgi:hypothetical protein
MSKCRRHCLWLWLGLLPLAMSSCRTVAPLASDAEYQLPLRFESSLPARFDSRQTLMFEVRPHWWWPSVRLTALGFASIDRTRHDYAVVCLSPLGMKIFEVARTNGQRRAVIQLPLPGDSDKFGEAIGDDIASLYFDLVPARDAAVSRRGGRLVFRETRDRRRVEYVFDVSTGRLERKTVDGDAGRSTITFEDYRSDGDAAYPAAMTLKNHRHGYTLSVTTLKLERLAPGAPIQLDGHRARK